MIEIFADINFVVCFSMLEVLIDNSANLLLS